MANLLTRGANAHAAWMKRGAGQAVTYRQGETEVPLTMWPERQTFQVAGEDGLLNAINSFNWCCIAAELGLTPRSGDTIEATGSTYSVLPIDNLKCFEPLDTDGVSLLIRTKQLV